jgi:tetratricopeptide (TPR) repeat protein
MYSKKKVAMAENTNLFTWVHEDELRLQEQGGEWQVIVDNHHQFWRNFDDDFLAAELAITRALEAARATNEIKWELYLRHWRMQLWFRQSQVRRALPEAVDLLALATDRRVQDVPQRICAYHDIIDCYAVMDPVGYHQDIVENSQEILAQLPQKYDCATCARSHLLYTMAVTGKEEQADHWRNQIQANEQTLRPSLLLDFGDASMALGKWDEARQYYQQALSLARERDDFDRYVKATLGSLYASLKAGDMRDVLSTLRKTRQLIKENDNNTNLAKFLEISGAAMLVTNELSDALDYLGQAARLYYTLGLYRDAAQCAGARC